MSLRSPASASALLATFPLLVLLGCGGGGGGGGGDGGDAPQPNVPLTASNAGTAANVSVDGAQGGVGVINGGSGFLKPGTAARRGVNPARWGLTQLQSAWDQTGVRAARSGKPNEQVINDSEACDSGLVSWTHDDPDNDGEVSTGDSFVFTFSSCQVDGLGINGSLTIDELVLTSNPLGDDFAGSARFVFNGLTLADGSEVFTINGTLRVTLSFVGDDVSVTVTSDSITLQTAQSTTTLQAFTTTYAENELTGVFSWSANGVLTDTRLGGTVHFQTTTTFTGDYDVSDNPASGVLLITGLNGSKVRLTALNVTQAQVETDANGDGTFETSQTIDWDDLDLL